MANAPRWRRASSLLLLVVGLAIPMGLNIFFMEDVSVLSLHHVSSNGLAYPGEEEMTAARPGTNNPVLLQMKAHRQRMNDETTEVGSYLFFPQYEYQQSVRKRSIRALVSAFVGLAVPFMAFLYALAFRKNPQGLINRSVDKERRRVNRITRGLEECRVTIPSVIEGNVVRNRNCIPTTRGNEEDLKECPICLSAFRVGESVIASIHCQCSTGTKSSDAAGEDHIPISHRVFFHEDCIVTWLAQRQANPKKLCPCCRQPFLGLKQRKGGQSVD